MRGRWSITIAGWRSTTEIAEELVEIYEVDFDRAGEDVERVIKKFAELELVQEGLLQGCR